MPGLWYIISLSHTVKAICLVSLKIKYLLLGGTVLYPHTKTLCHAIACNNKNHCSKNTFLTLKHRWLLHGRYSKCFLVNLVSVKKQTHLNCMLCDGAIINTLLLCVWSTKGKFLITFSVLVHISPLVLSQVELICSSYKLARLLQPQKYISNIYIFSI